MKVALLAATFFFSVLAHAQTPQTLQIFGRVVDASSGGGVGGVEVMLVDGSTTPPKRLDPKDIGTRADGTYSMPLAAALSKKVTLRLHFSKVGYVRDPTLLVLDLSKAAQQQEDVYVALKKQSAAYYNALSENARTHGPSTLEKSSPYLPVILALPEQERTQTLQQIGKLDAAVYAEYSMALKSDLAVKLMTQKYLTTDFGFRANAPVPGSVLVYGKVKSEDDKAQVFKDLYSKGAGIVIDDQLLVRNTAKPLPTYEFANSPNQQFRLHVPSAIKLNPD